MLNRSNKLISKALLAVLLFFFSGCVTMYNPATKKKETLLINTPQEVSLGVDMDKELQVKLKMSNSPQMNKRLNSIGEKLVKFSDRNDINYHFRVVSDKELNAFAIPGGFVYVNSGLMDIANDDELAGVVAHELGHIAAKHSVKRLQTVMGYQIFLGLVSGISGQPVMNDALNIVFNLVNLGYSRKDELLADKLAVRYVRRTGYSPIGLVTFFEKLKREGEKRGSNSKLVFLSSHPQIQDRIVKVEEEMKLNPY
jgi:predicted Zn-dependent protease